MAKPLRFLQPDTTNNWWFVRVKPTKPVGDYPIRKVRDRHGVYVRWDARVPRVPIPGAKTEKVYLSRDKTVAETIAKFLYVPYVVGDLEECKRRRDIAKAELERFGRLDGLEIFSQQLDDFDGYPDHFHRPEDFRPKDRKDLERCVADVKQAIAEYDEDLENETDKELPLADSAYGEIQKLGLKDRHDPIGELLTTVIANASPEVIEEVRAAIEKRIGAKSPKPTTAEKLSDCLPPWRQRIDAKKRTKGHEQAYAGAFDLFVAFVGDVPLSDLTKMDFVNYQNHIDATHLERSEKTRNDKLKPIGTILREARRLTEWKFPPELDQWLEVFEYNAYEPDPENAEPMSVECFKALLTKAEEWANLDAGTYAKALPIGNRNQKLGEGNNVKQANRIKRCGIQWAAILRLACNVAAENQDISFVGYKHLSLDDPLPLFTLRRKKNKIDRRTPLLPSTIAAIKRWRAYQSEVDGRVFSNDAKRPFTGKVVSKDFRRLCDEAKLPDGSKVPQTVEFKTLRNVAGTVGKKHRRHRDERDAIRGHSLDGVGCKFYEGDVGDDYLVPLVNLIGQEYFDGQQVGGGN